MLPGKGAAQDFSGAVEAAPQFLQAAVSTHASQGFPPRGARPRVVTCELPFCVFISTNVTLGSPGGSIGGMLCVPSLQTRFTFPHWPVSLSL